MDVATKINKASEANDLQSNPITSSVKTIIDILGKNSKEFNQTLATFKFLP